MQVQVELFRSTQFNGFCWICDYAEDVLFMCLHWRSVIAKYGYTGHRNILAGPWKSQRYLPVGCIPIHHLSHVWSCQFMPSVYAVTCCYTLMYSSSYRSRWVLYYVSETRGYNKIDDENFRLSEHHCGQVAPLHGVCHPNWEWSLPPGQRSRTQGSNCAAVVQ